MQGKAAIIQPFLMATIMCFLMTALITVINLGPVSDYFFRWIKAFLIAWPAAVAAAFIAIPIARRLTSRIVGWLDGAKS
ncbi:MAG: DUF2798 domain-containing protein [Alphaproteobacteria bacterium]|jgi:hypothetical protein